MQRPESRSLESGRESTRSAGELLLGSLRREEGRGIIGGAQGVAVGFLFGGFFLVVTGDAHRGGDALAGNGDQREDGE